MPSPCGQLRAETACYQQDIGLELRKERTGVPGTVLALSQDGVNNAS